VIGVVSHPGDDHALAVLAELARRRQPAVLLDTGTFPHEARLSMRAGRDGVHRHVRLPEARVDLDAVGAVWWRRPRPYTLDPALDPSVASFVLSESHEAISGVLAGLDATWVNPAPEDEAAHHKPYQLAAALAAGLAIPDTLVTNDPDEAQAFVAARGPANTVFKTFLATEEHWRETRVLQAAELELLGHVRLAPVIFQERVTAVADLRVTVMGDELFAAEITTRPGGYDLDYRVELGRAQFRPARIPSDVEDGVRRLLGRLGLVYGAVDLLLTPEGSHVFLEVNPAGEWRFVEERTGQAMTQAMAGLLARLDQERRR
jgi:glutathione synthase/RimK-type ligase-like ATP-grasp enzyme